jgi:hypothetical protein
LDAVVTTLQAARPDSQQGLEFFLLATTTTHPVTGFGAHAASYPSGIVGFSLGVNWKGHEADHSPPCNAQVRNAWRYNSTPIHAISNECINF